MEPKETKLEACYATVGITEYGENLPVLLWVGVPTNVVINEAYDKILPDKYKSWRVVDVKWGDEIVAI